MRSLLRRLGIGRWLYLRSLSAKVRRRRRWLRGTPAGALRPEFCGTTDLMHWLAENDPGVRTIWDVGANRGHWALLARSFFPRASITCFEPLEMHAAELARIAAAHGPVRHVQTAVGAENGRAIFYRTRYSDCSSLFEPQKSNQWGDLLAVEEQIEVPVLCLDDFQSAERVDFPDLLKIDVQGAELAALRGGTKVIAAARWLLVEVQFVPCYTGACVAAEVIAFLWERGFEPIGLERDTEQWEALNQADILFRKRRQ